MTSDVDEIFENSAFDARHSPPKADVNAGRLVRPVPPLAEDNPI